MTISIASLDRLRNLKWFVVTLTVFLYFTPASAQTKPTSTDYCRPATPADSRTPIVCKPVYFDISAKKLSEIELPKVETKGPHAIHEVRRVPIVRSKGALTDPLIQSTPGSALSTVDSGFEGLGKGLGYQASGFPPDTTLAVGTDHLVEWVNTDFVIFDKHTQKPLGGLTAGNILWAGFGGTDPKNPARRCATNNDGDPIVMFDRIEKRWIFSQFAYLGGPPYLQCIAVSTSPDPRGTYARYAYSFEVFNDYGKFGLWPNGYYASFNMYESPDGPFLGSRMCGFDREKMLSGKTAVMVCFNAQGFASTLPADMDNALSTAQAKQKASMPALFVNMQANGLNTWKFTPNWSAPEKSKLSGPEIVDGVSPFIFSCREEAASDQCRTVPQNQSDVLLDSMGDRLMYRLAYRDFGDHATLLANHAVSASNTSGKPPIAFRWYEIATQGTKFKVTNSGTYAPNRESRWMGSIAMDKVGNLAIAYTASDGSTFPSIRYSGRASDTRDKANTLGEEKVLFKGGASQTIYSWGDYTTLAVDPTDECTFWFVAQYLTEQDKDFWHTRVSNIKFNNCH